jgi:hypothetical protein
MKKLATLSTIFILVANYLFAQNSPSVWTHKANNGGNEIIISDNSQTAYVFDSGSQGASIPSVKKLNPINGVQIFSNTYLPIGYTNMQFNAALYHQNYIYFASTVNSSTLSNRLCLTKIDLSGNLIQQLVVDSIAINQLMNQLASPYYSLGFFVDANDQLHIGFTKSDSTFFQYFAFLKFDLTFNFLANFDFPLGYFPTPGQIAYQSDGSLFFSYTGSVSKLKSDYSAIAWTAPLTEQYMFPKSITSNSSNYVYVLGRDDSNGTGTHILCFLDGGNSYSPVYDIVCSSNTNFDMTRIENQLSTNSLYVTGYMNISPMNHLVVKLDATTGNILWTDSVADGQFISNIFITANGNLIAVGGGTDYKVWLYNSSGSVDKTLTYDGLCNFNDQIKSAVLMSQNLLAVTGYACENSNTIAWGTTLLYNIPTITTGVNESNSDLALEIYPSPAFGILKINTNEEIRSLELINSMGQLIQLPMATKNELNVSSLTNGIYFLKITTNKGSYEKSFMK